LFAPPQKLVPANISAVDTILAKQLNVFPNGLPDDVTLFLPSDDYIRYVARVSGFNNATASFKEYVEVSRVAPVRRMFRLAVCNLACNGCRRRRAPPPPAWSLQHPHGLAGRHALPPPRLVAAAPTPPHQWLADPYPHHHAARGHSFSPRMRPRWACCATTSSTALSLPSSRSMTSSASA
jgi:hypothetical protein